jgi:hypothetical protein
MTVHTGNLIDSLIQSEEYYLEDTRDAETLPGEELTGAVADGTVTLDTDAHVGDLQPTTWELIAEDKIYLTPDEIDAGLIGIDTEHEIGIWNAGQEEITITAIDQSTDEGFTLSIPLPPITLTGESLYSYALTVLAEGPPTQDTTFTFTFSNGDVKTLLLTGRRIEVFAYEVDGSSPVTVSWAYQTVIANSDMFVEQRRSLTPNAVLRMEASFWFETLKTQQFFFAMRAWSDRVLAVPIYVEEFRLSSDPDGLTVLAIAGDDGELETRWFLEHATYLLLLNIDDATTYELLEIDAIDTVNNEITVTATVSREFPPETTRAYPVMISFAPEITGEHLTGTIVRYQLVFEEYQN